MLDKEFDYEVCANKVKPIASALIKKYDELAHIDPDKILFIVNHVARDNKLRLAKTTRIQPRWSEIMYQLGATPYFYMIELYAKTTAVMEEEQIVALVYRELLKISPEGDIVTPDVNDWWRLIRCMGHDWFLPKHSVPNLLDENVTWSKLMGGR